jgi:hypothetical protein
MFIQRSVSAVIFLFGGRYPGHPYLGGAHRRPIRFPTLHLRTPSPPTIPNREPGPKPDPEPEPGSDPDVLPLGSTPEPEGVPPLPESEPMPV